MDRSVFGEGICPLSNDKIAVLTWQSNAVYILSQKDLKVIQTLPLFKGLAEGWGITQFPASEPSHNFNLYVSDGSSKIQVVDG